VIKIALKNEGKNSQNKLADEFVVFTTIYEITKIKKEVVWRQKLFRALRGKLKQKRIEDCLRALSAWSLIKQEYGPADKNSSKRLIFISSESMQLAKEQYEKYVKKEE
jgi:hypothetical protein